MNANRIIEAMTAILEAPGYPLLKFYKTDFAADKLQIQSAWHPAMRMLWIVRESGTALGTIGVHQRNNEALRVVIDHHQYNNTLDKMDCVLLTRDGVSKIAADRALAELKKLDYVVTRDKVMDSRGSELASFDLKLSQGGNRLTGDVAFTTSNPEILSQGHHHIALLQIAQCEVVNAWQSLFTSTRKVSLNGADLTAMVRSQESESV